MLSFWARMAVKISTILGFTSMCASICMMFLITADILLRYFWGSPIKGTFEITGLMLVITFFFGLAYAQVQQSHISVDIIVSRLPRRTQSILGSFSYLVYFSFVLLMTWRTFLYGMEALRIGEKTSILDVQIAPFVFLAALGCLVLCAAVMVDLIKSISQAVKK